MYQVTTLRLYDYRMPDGCVKTSLMYRTTEAAEANKIFDEMKNYGYCRLEQYTENENSWYNIVCALWGPQRLWTPRKFENKFPDVLFYGYRSGENQ